MEFGEKAPINIEPEIEPLQEVIETPTDVLGAMGDVAEETKNLEGQVTKTMNPRARRLFGGVRAKIVVALAGTGLSFILTGCPTQSKNPKPDQSPIPGATVVSGHGLDKPKEEVKVSQEQKVQIAIKETEDKLQDAAIKLAKLQQEKPSLTRDREIEEVKESIGRFQESIESLKTVTTLRKDTESLFGRSKGVSMKDQVAAKQAREQQEKDAKEAKEAREKKIQELEKKLALQQENYKKYRGEYIELLSGRDMQLSKDQRATLDKINELQKKQWLVTQSVVPLKPEMTRISPSGGTFIESQQDRDQINRLKLELSQQKDRAKADQLQQQIKDLETNIRGDYVKGSERKKTTEQKKADSKQLKKLAAALEQADSSDQIKEVLGQVRELEGVDDKLQILRSEEKRLAEAIAEQQGVLRGSPAKKAMDLQEKMQEALDAISNIQRQMYYGR